jgi:translation initiation factor 1
MSGLFAGTPLERPITCEHCARPLAECRCPRSADGRLCLPGQQLARIWRQRRAGDKVVTIIRGLDASASDLPGLLKELRAACAAGGSITPEGEIQLQGDHRQRVLDMLKEKGYPAKLAGG